MNRASACWPVLLLAVGAGCQATSPTTELEWGEAQFFQSTFETVAFARARLLARQLDAVGQGPEAFLAAPHGWSQDALGQLGPEVYRIVLGSSTAVILGAKDFKRPQGPPPHLGAVRSSMCSEFLMPKGLPDEVRRLLDHRAGPPTRGEWHWAARRMEGDAGGVIMSAAAKSGIGLVICNHPGGIGLLLAPPLAGKAPALGAAPVPLREAVSRTGAWIARRVRHSAEDRLAAALNEIGPEVDSLVVVPGSGGRTIGLSVSCRSRGTSPLQALERKGPLPPAKEVAPGRWETEVGASISEKDASAHFVVLYLLGFGAFI